MFGIAPMLCILVLVVATGAPGSTRTPRVALGHAVAFQRVNLCGRVVDYGCHEATDTVRLELEKNDGAGIVGFGIPAKALPAFGERFEYQFLGREVCGVGFVEKLGGDNVVMIADPPSLSAQGYAPWAAAPFAPGAVRFCTAGLVKPVLTREVKPSYTQDAMRAKIQGTVALEAIVLPSGRVGDVRVIRSLDSATGLDREAVSAAKRWRFRPGTLHGEPVPVIVRIDLTFTLT